MKTLSLLLALFLSVGVVLAGDPPLSESVEERSRKLAAAVELLRADNPEDQAEGMRLLEEAAEAGEAEALTNLGAARLRGLGGTEPDESAALELWEKAAAMGSARALLNRGILLRQATTIPPQPEQSLEELHKAASTGLIEAHSVLGRLLFNGDRFQTKDYAAALPHLRVAAEAGDAVCQNTLGVALRDGLGTTSDLEEARGWFRKSAEQNHPKGQSNLAKILGVDAPGSPDREEALTWLIIAKDQNEPTAIRTFNELFISFSPGELARAQKAAEKHLRERLQKTATPE